MTGKRDFNAEEWEKLVRGPALAALRVIAADRGGTIRETLSLGRAYAEARQRGGNGLLDEIVSSPPQLDPAATRSPEQLPEQANQALREAIELLERKATPEEVEDYRKFLLAVADTVAHAHKEGGFLGIGGKEVSESEQAVLDELAGTVAR
ncbi:MAG: hypothetical protein ACRDSN_02635 [Pseudonocardiaceae bacterium]